MANVTERTVLAGSGCDAKHDSHDTHPVWVQSASTEVNVPLKTAAYYRTIAAEALARVDCSEPPVPMETLVESYGIPIRRVMLPNFFTGMLVYEDGLPAIVINFAIPEDLRRRALGHMLGHMLLALKGEEFAFPRAVQDHREADTVAEELMLPADMVRSQASLWFNDYRYLSRLFGVGEDVMLERMRELGLIKGQQGFSWDY